MRPEYRSLWGSFSFGIASDKVILTGKLEFAPKTLSFKIQGQKITTAVTYKRSPFAYHDFPTYSVMVRSTPFRFAGRGCTLQRLHSVRAWTQVMWINRVSQ